MKLVDSNVWIALVVTGHHHHELVVAWLCEEPLERSLLLCRFTQMMLVRLLTTRAVLQPFGVPPLTNAEAIGVYEALRGDRRVAYADEPPGVESCWKRLASRAEASPKTWMDAYLAAFAISGGHQLITLETAYVEYPGLDLRVLRP